MKKAFCIALIFIVLLQSGGMMLVFLLQRAQSYAERNEDVKKHFTSFERMVLSSETYRKSKTMEDEVSIDGKMYDVKQVTFHGSDVELLVCHDVEEDNLIASIRSIFNPGSGVGKDFPNQLLKLIVSSYTVPLNAVYFHETSVTSVYSIASGSFYSSLPGGSFSPPPENIS